MKSHVSTRPLGLTVIAVLALAQGLFGVLRTLHWVEVGGDFMERGLLILPLLGLLAIGRGMVVGFGCTLWGFFVRPPAAAELGQGAGNILVPREFAPRRECGDAWRIAGLGARLGDHPGGHSLLPDVADWASSTRGGCSGGIRTAKKSRSRDDKRDSGGCCQVVGKAEEEFFLSVTSGN